MRRLPHAVVALLLAFALAACRSDCPACGDVIVPEPVATLTVALCASEVPDPDPVERRCAAQIAIDYRLVGSD